MYTKSIRGSILYCRPNVYELMKRQNVTYMYNVTQPQRNEILIAAKRVDFANHALHENTVSNVQNKHPHNVEIRLVFYEEIADWEQ